jgi:ATP-dependent RNA helicase DeaD
VIATVAERRKAERLLGAAHIKIDWTPPPSAETIAAAARARLGDELAGGAEPAPDVADAADDLLSRLEGKLPTRELLRRLVSRELGRLPGGEPLRAVSIQPAGRDAGRRDGNQPPGPRQSHAQFAREGVAFRINLGADDRADPRWLLPLICRRGGVTRREVGAIRIGPHETLFEIAGDAAHDFALAAGEPDPRARHVVIARADAPPARAPEHARPHQPPRSPERPRPHQPPRSPERARPHQPPRSPEPPRLPGGYHPLQRRKPSQNVPAPPRPHPPGKPRKHRGPR